MTEPAKKIEISAPCMLKLTDDEYNAAPGVRNTELGYLEQSPAHLQEYLKNPPEPTPALIFGQEFHAAALEPTLWMSRTVVAPKIDKRTKEGKAEYESWLLANHGKRVVEADKYDAIKGMVESLYSHPAASKLLSSGHAEHSYFAQDAETGLLRKVKPDYLRDGRVVVDLKSTQDASPKAFQKSVANFNYARQAAWYLDVISDVTGQCYDSFVLIAVEKAPPYAVAVYALDDATIEVGRAQYKSLLKTYKKCLTENKWPAYSEEIQDMSLPSWAWPTFGDL